MVRNKFEAEISEALAGLADYEPKKIKYVSHHKYLPDFVGDHTKNGKEIIVEAKGYFRVGDTKKYTSIRDSLLVQQELVFLLYDHTKPIRKRAKMNMGEWCEKEGLRWFTKENIRDAFTT